MFDALPRDARQVFDWNWTRVQPFVDDLLARSLSAETVPAYLADWTLLSRLLGEWGSRLYMGTTVNTADETVKQQFYAYLEKISEPWQAAENQLKQKLLASGLTLAGMEIPLRGMRTEAELFREANIPLFTQERKLSTDYDSVIGAQTVTWEGEEKTLTQLKPVLQSDDRALRERVWRLISQRRLADRSRLNSLWRQFMDLRRQQTSNAGFADYRAFRWKQFLRFEYTPADCETFHRAIEQVVVPAATRVYQRQRDLLGVETLRPWDLDRDDVYPPSRPPLKPFDSVEVLSSKAEGIFRQVDPELGEYYALMRREGLLDLENRKNKAPGGYQLNLNMVRRPFIFMNAVGVHDDVQTLLHEGGHAFHMFESSRLPYIQQWEFGAEIAEVASMSMELLAAPYLTESEGGYYTAADAAHARIEHLEHMLLFWPFMAVVDAFQHWVYTHHDAASEPANCDAKWGELWDRFLPGMDWSGLDDARVTGWHRKVHIFSIPFYYVDYGLAQVGALQIWRNALKDPASAVQQYRHALSLGGTRTLPELFSAAGARFAFDAETLGELVTLIEQTIQQLQTIH